MVWNVPSGNNIPLVVVGKVTDYHHRVQKFIEADLNRLQVFFLSRINDDELAVLYQMADVMIYPSFFEGFGLPVLEALASGTAVVCSRAASLPEVGGTVVRYVDALATDSIRSACQTILENDCQRRSLERLGLQQASGFSWERTVSETVAAYVYI